jgi:hypothetical protein
MIEDMSYWLSYGKPGKRVLVSSNGVDDEGNDVASFIWVDLDHHVAETWDWVKPFEEVIDIS